MCDLITNDGHHLDNDHNFVVWIGVCLLFVFCWKMSGRLTHPTERVCVWAPAFAELPLNPAPKPPPPWLNVCVAAAALAALADKPSPPKPPERGKTFPWWSNGYFKFYKKKLTV
jgi:hypothetical protein